MGKDGVVGLNEVMKGVAEDFSTGADEKAAQELLNRLKKRNYIPDAAREAYREAFLREFKRFLGQPDAEEDARGTVVKILGQGCARCDGLEREIMDVMAELALEAEIEHVRDIKEIASYGVMGVPALIINGQVRSVGSVPPRAKLIEWLKEARRK
jgi:small redox-active disulfide protein 2